MATKSGWGGYGSLWNFLTNHRPPHGPGIVQVVAAMVEADRGLAECERILERMYVQLGMSRAEARRLVGRTRRGP
jgi:hypothetical protein